MQSTLLSELMASTHAIKVFWDTLDTEVRTHMLRQLFQSRELIDKRSKVHAYDDLLAQRLRFRIRSITEKPISWRIEKFLLQCDAQPRVIHDVCRRYLTTIHAERFQHIQQMANGSDPEPTNGKYPPEWYLRIVEYLLNDVAPPLPCMLVFSMFAECEGRNEALKDERYQTLWERQCQWAATRLALPPHERTIPDVLHVAPPPVDPAPKLAPARVAPAKTTVSDKPALKAVVERPVVLPPPPPLPDLPPSFSALQYVVNRAVEDSCAHIKGALAPELMRDALLELLHLNSDSAQYHYHLGYYYGLAEVKFTVDKQQPQLAQAWAFLGYVVGCYRTQGDAVADVVGRHSAIWHLVLTQLPASDLQVLYRLLPALIAHKSYDDIAEIMTHCPVPDLKFAEHPDSVTMQIYTIAADLVRSGAHLPQADRILQVLIAQLSAEGLCGNVYGRCLRKRGQFYRRKKQFNQAGDLFREAIAVPGFSEIAQTHADIGMTLAGYAGLDALLPSDHNDFRIVTQALRQHRQHFDDAVSCNDGDDTNAQFVLGLLDFGNGDYPGALEHFRLAQIGMERQIAAYRVRDLYDWLLFLKIRTWSQQLELSEIPLFRDELALVFTAQTFFPLKHWLQIFRDVNKIHAETGRSVMLHLFNYRDVDIYDLCNIEEVFKHTDEIWRRYFFGSAKYNALARADKFTHLTQAWQVVLLTQNTDAADFVLELLELHGNSFSEYAGPVHKLILEYLEDILRIWDETDVLFLRVQLLFMLGQSDEAVSLLVQLCNIYLGRQELTQARAMYDWLAQLNYPNLADYTPIIHAPRQHAPNRTLCNVLYIGGNETQQSFKEFIDAKLVQHHPHIRVEWELIGWSSNWGDEAARIERRIPAFDLVILSPYVRTLFGRQIRKAASNWRASTGKGQGKIYADIVAAVESFQTN